MADIVRTDDTLGGDPWIEGTRIGVHHVYELVVTGDYPPEDVADQLGIDLSEVHAALAYYYDNPETMREVRQRHEAIEDELAESALRPPEVVD